MLEHVIHHFAGERVSRKEVILSIADMDCKAKAFVGLCVKKQHINMVEQAATAKGLWDTFKATFKGPNNARKISLRAEGVELLPEGDFPGVIFRLECGFEGVPKTLCCSSLSSTTHVQTAKAFRCSRP